MIAEPELWKEWKEPPGSESVTVSYRISQFYGPEYESRVWLEVPWHEAKERMRVLLREWDEAAEFPMLTGFNDAADMLLRAALGEDTDG